MLVAARKRRNVHRHEVERRGCAFAQSRSAPDTCPDDGRDATGGASADRRERGRALDELRGAVDVAAARGDHGEIQVESYLAEALLRGSPRIAEQIATRVYGPLSDELVRTLDVLVQHSFERASTAAALPVHRNTLRDGINRISEITGVDLDHAYGRGLAWLAWLHRKGDADR